ncbi:MAG: hypothetical protein UW94_C0005G0065 [Parcubacteria group bacterium GW2011_GWA2_45_14]|nr:MAG: hypothetical protein UW94_C0005G0065 [Parcubacteria group bacterium GW2011_GWA2_45_14]
MGKLHEFSFRSMFGRDISDGDVRRMCKGMTCCLSGKQIKHDTWLAIVRKRGKLCVCLPEHVNGHETCVPTREMVEKLVPGLSSMNLTVLDRYSTGTRKRKRAKAVAGV